MQYFKTFVSGMPELCDQSYIRRPLSIYIFFLMVFVPAGREKTHAWSCIHDSILLWLEVLLTSL